MDAPLMDWTLDKARRYHGSGRLDKVEKMCPRAPVPAERIWRLGPRHQQIGDEIAKKVIRR
jgi:hypothetical protein